MPEEKKKNYQLKAEEKVEALTGVCSVRCLAILAMNSVKIDLLIRSHINRGAGERIDVCVGGGSGGGESRGRQEPARGSSQSVWKLLFRLFSVANVAAIDAFIAVVEPVQKLTHLGILAGDFYPLTDPYYAWVSRSPRHLPQRAGSCWNIIQQPTSVLQGKSTTNINIVVRVYCQDQYYITKISDNNVIDIVSLQVLLVLQCKSARNVNITS